MGHGHILNDLSLAAQNTRSEIQALDTPIHRVNSGVNSLLQQSEVTIRRLSQMQHQARQTHDLRLELRRAVSNQQDANPGQSLEQSLVTALASSGTERELLRQSLESLSKQRQEETVEVAARMKDLVSL